MAGQIFQINASKGGVPKTPLRIAEVNELGITVDQQRYTKVHGGPDKALCLYSVELIAALQKEGHPIYAGAIGENLTTSGIDWQDMTIGSRWQIGSAVQIEITSYAVPCNHIGPSFINKRSKRVHAEENPGWARTYARVLQDGVIRLGDEIKPLPLEQA